ncbi:MAG: anthranilate phosphoribosyltransferase, partial [Planctomycetota bacterium]
PHLTRLLAGEPLTEDQSYRAFTTIMGGHASDAQIGALLTAVAMRPDGPAVDELVGAARAMRDVAVPVAVPEGVDVIDTCGTGGVHGVTFNVSTAAAIIAAGAGATVAKHGNRSVTSRSGSSQVLEALGVNLTGDSDTLTRCLAEARLCFCFAVNHHPAMRHAIGPRRELGFRTIFNLLGPLTNPAGAKRQLLGVASLDLTEKMARALQRLGAVKAFVMHGDNQDDLATTGPTQITTLADGALQTDTITPEQFGLKRASLDDLQIESIEDSANKIRALLDGETGPRRDIATLNAAAALYVADIAQDLTEGLTLANAAIDSRQAKNVLDTLVEITNAN